MINQNYETNITEIHNYHCLNIKQVLVMTKYKIKSISGKTIAMKEESTKAFCRYCGDEIMCRCKITIMIHV